MKLTVIILLVACLQVSATGFSQNVTLLEKNISLETVLKKINEQTGYRFFYSDQLMKKTGKLNIEVKNMPVKEVLNLCFEKFPITYSIVEKTIVIKEINANTTTIPVALTVRGSVVNDKGEPVVATISIKGSKNATSTNEYGEFVLTDVGANAILVITGVGIETKEVKAIFDEPMYIVINTKIQEVAEVIVSTGYQKISKARMTGAAATISGAELNQRVSVAGSFLESLQGKIPGLLYNKNTGELSIRGAATLFSGRSPLIVVDGFPMNLNLSTINPTDVISVSVLKDAAASAIYGAMAGNGVIVIETKRGRAGQAQVSVRATLGYQQAAQLSSLNFAKASDYVQLEKIKAIKNFSTQLDEGYNNGKGFPLNPVQMAVWQYKKGQITEQEMSNRITAIGNYDNLDDVQSIMYRNSLTRNIDLSVGGGSEKNTYLIGLNYIGQDGFQKMNSSHKAAINFAMTNQLSKWLKLDFKGTYNYTQSKGTSVGLDYTSGFAPYDSLTDANGKAKPTPLSPGFYNVYAINKLRNDSLLLLGMYDMRYFPVNELTANTYTSEGAAYRMQARLDAKLTPWLNYEIGGVYETSPGMTENLITQDAYLLRKYLNYSATKKENGEPSFVTLQRGDLFKRSNDNMKSYTVRSQFNVHANGKDYTHSLNAIIGAEVRSSLYTNNLSSYFGYDNQGMLSKPVNLVKLSTIGKDQPDFVTLLPPIGVDFSASNYYRNGESQRRFVSTYGNGTYLYKSRYALTGSFRIDQSNLFGSEPKYRSNPFYSVGANWNISKESYLVDNKWVNDLRLRIAYGAMGNVPDYDAGRYLVLSRSINDFVTPSVIMNSVNNPVNQQITWERIYTYNAGLDYAFFNNRLYGSIDYYLKNSQNLIGLKAADPTKGYDQYNANTASMKNRGLEFSINYISVLTQNFRWQTQVSASFNKNRITKIYSTFSSSGDLVNASMIGNMNMIQGYPVDALFAYNYAGLDNLGRPQVYTTDGTKKVLSATNVIVDDMKYIGTASPQQTIGLNNQITWKSFDLSFLFTYFGGYYTRFIAPSPSYIMQNIGRFEGGYENYWKKAGDEAVTDIPGLPDIGSPGEFDGNAAMSYFYASKFTRRADHIRLSDVVLTYTFPNMITKRIRLGHTQLRFQAQNLWKYNMYGGDFDPDYIKRRSGERLMIQKPIFSFSLFTDF